MRLTVAGGGAAAAVREQGVPLCGGEGQVDLHTHEVAHQVRVTGQRKQLHIRCSVVHCAVCLEASVTYAVACTAVL